MKFNINAKVFKNITERVAIILNKKNMFPAFRTLVIETDNNMVKVFGTSDCLNSYVAVYMERCVQCICVSQKMDLIQQ